LDDSRNLLNALQRADAYPHPVAGIRVVETHISWVLLTGEFAYKLKKPVKLGFVDFSTLEQRHRFCEEELRLNRRYSPDLYLDVVPITGSVERPRIGGGGPPVEFAVRMRQFPDEAILSRQLRANRVTPHHVDALARVIADFHRDAAVATVESPWGTCEAIWAPVAENFAQLQSAGSDSPQIQQLSEWSQAEFGRLRTVFDQRRRDGFVRECHGDLHTNNILLLNDQPRMFDCVEFNDSFRWVDVLSDLAFLCMDLADVGRADFAQRLVNAYLEITGDYAGLATWRFYLVYRSMVRAKVAAIRTQQAPDLQQRDAAMQDVATYLKLASEIIRPRVPKLFITYGPSGSGKSTLTQPLLESIGAIRIRSDVERRRMPSGTLDGDRYGDTARRRVYERMEQLAESVLAAGISAIVDATFLARADRTRFHRLAERLSLEFVIIDFQTPTDVLRERVARRQSAGTDVSEAGVDVLDAQLTSAEPLDSDERDAAIIVDTTQPDAAVVRQLCSIVD